jgi:hypothetical protein
MKSAKIYALEEDVKITVIQIYSICTRWITNWIQSKQCYLLCLLDNTYDVAGLFTQIGTQTEHTVFHMAHVTVYCTFKTIGKFMPSILAQCFWLKSCKVKDGWFGLWMLVLCEKQSACTLSLVVWSHEPVRRRKTERFVSSHSGVNDPTLLHCQGMYVIINVTVFWIVMPHSFVEEPATRIFRVEPQILCHYTLKFKFSFKISIFFTL